MATIKDVAERAGLSVTLVSRYLNEKKGVSERSKQKIMQAIDELNYRPNGNARSLVLQKTNAIGIVVNTLDAPFIAPLIAGIERGLEEFNKEHRYTVLFCSSNRDMNKKRQHIAYLTQGRVDGIIIYGSLAADDTLVHQLAETNFPFLLIENDMKDLEVNKVIIDNQGGAYKATQFLIEQGYTKIAHMTGNMNYKITLDRMNGYVMALQDHQLPVRQELIWHPDFSEMETNKAKDYHIRGDMSFYYAGYHKMKGILKSGMELPQAIFFATDISAFGAMKALEEAKIRVPEDIGLIGFDDEYPSDYGCSCQAISTMRQQFNEAGYIGIKTMIRDIENPQNKKKTVLLSTDMIIRDSSLNVCMDSHPVGK